MSTGPTAQAAFIQGNQSTTEPDASHSALLYLFQEVSKLASPIHNSFLDTDSPSAWLNGTSRQGLFTAEKEEAEALKISTNSCQHSLSHTSPCHQMKKVMEESHDGEVATLMEPLSEHNSPWKVLNLINLQCDRLLHHSDMEKSDPSSVSSATNLSHQVDKFSDVAGHSVGSDCVSVKSAATSSFLINERQEISVCITPLDHVSRNCSVGARYCKTQCRAKDSKTGCRVLSQAAEKPNPDSPELIEGNVSSQPQHRDDKKEDKFRVNRHIEWIQECKKDCFSSEQDICHLINSNDDTSENPALTLDHNANLTLTSERPCDTKLPPNSAILPSSQPASLLFNLTENCHSLAEEEDDKITASDQECTHAPIEEKSPPAAQLKQSLPCNGETTPSPSATSKPEVPVRNVEIASPSNQQWRTKTPRKQPHPSRSADIQDPDFQGVTFRMDTELDDSREQCRLLITSSYSKELSKGVRRPRLRTRTSQKSLKTSSSDEESDPLTSVSRGKVCASCCTRKTPMWRDAEDGTPLCNACGIRYKKYRVRCVNCWHIPRKEGNSNSCCLKCGNFVRLTSAQRKHTT